MTNWQEVKLGDVCDFQNGYAFKSREFVTDGNINIVKIKELKNGQVVFTTDTAKVVNSEIYKQYQVSKGDILVALTGDPVSKSNPLSWVGRVSLYNYASKSLLNQRVAKFKPDGTRLDTIFIYYFFREFENFFNLAQKATGSASQANISTKTLNETIINLPPLDVQKKIAGVLGALDDKIELNNKINNNLEQQAQALFNEKILNNPKQGCIGDYCSIKSGFAFKSSWWQDVGVRVIKIKNIESSGLNLQECSYVSEDKISIAKDFVVKGGDLLIAMTGATIGKFAIVPHVDEILLVNQRVGKFFLGDNPLEKLPFIYCTLKQPEVVSEIINRGQGSAQPNISGNDIMSIACTYPDENIIANFNNICRPYFEKIIMNQYENTQLSALRDTLLPKLMSGEIDVDKVSLRGV